MLENSAMKTELTYRLVNVFALEGERFSGNPLAVFEDGRGLDDATMLAIARELNLSETTFVVPPKDASATAGVRIFTPSYEMPFAGHPTLGTAHVVAERAGARDHVVLEMKAGLVRVATAGSLLELRTARAPVTRPWSGGDMAALAQALSLPANAIAAPPLWVDTGVEQLIVRLTRPEHVLAMRADAGALLRVARSERTDEGMVYAFAEHDEHRVEARFVFSQGTLLVEDPATGSACANLGGYFLATGARGPLRRVVRQGAAVERPSELHLRIDDADNIHVAGRVHSVGSGTLTIA